MRCKCPYQLLLTAGTRCLRRVRELMRAVSILVAECKWDYLRHD